MAEQDKRKDGPAAEAQANAGAGAQAGAEGQRQSGQGAGGAQARQGEGAEHAEAAEAREGQGQAAEAARQQQAGEEPKPLDVYDALRICVGLLIQQAWIHLGIQAAPGTSETRTELPKARVAIDALADVWRHLEPAATEEERRDIEMTLTNLRINFAKRAG